MFAAMAAFAVIPVGGELRFHVGDVDVRIPMWISDLNVGILYIIGVGSLGVYGVVLGGWASNSKYSLLGALRGAAQLVSYELIVGMALAGTVMITGTMSLRGMVEWQAIHHVPLALLQPVSFVLYCIGACAETNRPPFDLPEADTELVAGYHTEYSGFRFSMFYLAEYMNMITVSCLAATVFLGGWAGPFGLLDARGTSGSGALGLLIIAVEVTVFLFVFVWVRATIPRLRYDQLMKLSWSVLLPIGLVNLAVTAIAVVVVDHYVK
jgi:NADH-quinone oxidoreductase subunit H